jgi:hypothetical protein
VPGKPASSGSISRLGPQFPDRRSRIARSGLPNAPNPRNSNRECFRLETGVTQRKQTPPTSSNRELGACFSAAHSTATWDGEIKEMQRPRWGSRAGTPNSGVAGGLTPALPYGKMPGQLRAGKKTKSRPPAFVAIRENYVIGFIRLKENFNLTM